LSYAKLNHIETIWSDLMTFYFLSVKAVFAKRDG